MTQAGFTGPMGTGAEPLGQPFGFASPHAPPLSEAEAPRQLNVGRRVVAPDAYVTPAQPVAPLESIEPTALAVRNPTEPFLETLPEPPGSSWRPEQPLPLSAATTNTAATNSGGPVPLPGDVLEALPPPTGRPVGVPPAPGPANPYATGPYPAPAHTGQPLGAPQRARYPVNPYATGPYSAPAPYGPPYAPAGTDPRRWPGRSQPITPQQVLAASDKFVMALLLIGTLWSQVAVYALTVAALVALLRSSQGKVLVAVAAVIGLLVGFVWWAGYLATSQMQGSAQLLCTICAIGVPLLAYQSLRRWS